MRVFQITRTFFRRGLHSALWDEGCEGRRGKARDSVLQPRHGTQMFRRGGGETEELQISGNLLEQHVRAHLHRAAACLGGGRKRPGRWSQTLCWRGVCSVLAVANVTQKSFALRFFLRAFFLGARSVRKPFGQVRNIHHFRPSAATFDLCR